MAITATWYGQFFLYQLGTGANKLAWAADTVNCSLHTSTYAQNVDTDDFWNDATNEVTGTNYVTKGVALSGKAITYDSATDETRLDANDPTFTNITVTGIRKAVFFKDTGVSSTSPLLWIFDFGADQTVAGADFIIQLDATGAAKVDTT